jgi:hypothetical protein
MKYNYSLTSYLSDKCPQYYSNWYIVESVLGIWCDQLVTLTFVVHHLAKHLSGLVEMVTNGCKNLALNEYCSVAVNLNNCVNFYFIDIS